MVRTATIQLDGLPVAVTFRKVTTLRIRVHPPYGDVTASAPSRMSVREARGLLESKLDWILASRASFVGYVDLAVSGDLDQVLMVWGTPIRAVECPVFRTVSEPDAMTAEARQALIIAWMRQVLHEQIARLLALWVPIMGVEPNEWRLRKMKTRWGSCNTRAKRLWFATTLVNRPIEQVEYVVVHELAHLIAPDHGKVFVGVMDRFLPDWRVRRKAINALLREQDFPEFDFK